MYTAMNRLLAANKENAENHVLLVCTKCSKAFTNRQTLISHLKYHEETMRSRNDWNRPDNSSTSVGITALNLSSFPHNQTDNPSGGSVFNGEASSSRLFSRFCSNQSGQLSAASFSENDVVNLNSQFVMSPNLSSGHDNVEFDYPQNFPPTSISPLGSNPVYGFPLDPSLVGSNGAFQYNINEIQSCLGGVSSPSADALRNFQSTKLSDFPFPTILAVDYPYPPVGSNHPAFTEEPTTRGLLSLTPCQIPGLDEVGQRNKGIAMESEGSKRLYLGDVSLDAEIMFVSKKAKIGPNRRAGKEKARKRQVPLFKDVESSDAKEESESGLDLSLHL